MKLNQMEWKQIPRSKVCENLRITLNRSYKLLPTEDANAGAVWEREVLALLNANRIRLAKLESICRLYTSEELEQECNGLFTEKQIVALTRRTKFPLPHIKIGTSVRFPAGVLEWWLRETKLPHRQRGIFRYETQ